MGCSVIVSQFFGAKEYKKMKTAVYTSMISSAVICFALMILGFLFCDPLLNLTNTPTELFAGLKLYLDIYVWGLPFVFSIILQQVFSRLWEILKHHLFFFAISSLSNIGVDILFVTAFDMGIAGVAWATFLCQGISCVLAIIVVFKRLRTINSNEKVVIFSFPILRKFLVVAIPSILQQSFVSVGNIVIQGIINGFGTGVMAGYSAAVKLNNLVITSFTTLANGISNYTAQNIGAQKLSRVKEGFHASVKLVWLLSAPLFIAYFFAGKWMLFLFMNEPTNIALESGINYLRILSPFYFVISVKLVTDGILRGAGMMNKFMTATFADLILRVVFAKVLSGTMLGATGIWCAWPIGWSISAIMSLIFYRSGEWESIKSSKEPYATQQK